MMGRTLFYGSGLMILGIGTWYYIQGNVAPDALDTFIIFLVALMSFGFGEKAKNDGEIGMAGSKKIKREKNPHLFKVALYLNYFLTGILLILFIYLVSY